MPSIIFTDKSNPCDENCGEELEEMERAVRDFFRLLAERRCGLNMTSSVIMSICASWLVDLYKGGMLDQDGVKKMGFEMLHVVCESMTNWDKQEERGNR